MKVALFSDIHGRFRVVLRMLRCWQLAHQARLDGALIAGDTGCFADVSRFDGATRKRCMQQPEEAGFSKYFVQPLPEVWSMIRQDPKLGAYSSLEFPILFVPGNHEDFDFLASCSKQGPASNGPARTFPVDCYQMFHCIKNGTVTSLSAMDNTSIRIAGLWGIEQGRADAPYVISEEAVEMLMIQGPGSFDVLLTHDAALDAYSGGRGSMLIAELIRFCEPPFHLFGHVKPREGRYEYNLEGTRTRSIHLNQVTFGKNSESNLADAMAILTWDGKQGEVEIVQDEWLSRMRSHNWDRVLP